MIEQPTGEQFQQPPEIKKTSPDKLVLGQVNIPGEKKFTQPIIESTPNETVLGYTEFNNNPPNILKENKSEDPNKNIDLSSNDENILKDQDLKEYDRGNGNILPPSPEPNIYKQ